MELHWQRIREKQNINRIEVKRNCFAESYLLEYYWSNRVQVGKNLLDFQIPLRDTEEGRWSEWIHTKS